MDDLTPIGTVVAFFGVPRSTLHYWERRGLVTPHRVAGRRCFDREQLYRVALIAHWQAAGLLRLDEIADLLAAHATGHDWRGTVAARIAAIDERRARLADARRYLEDLLDCPAADGLERCAGYRSTVTLPGR